MTTQSWILLGSLVGLAVVALMAAIKFRSRIKMPKTEGGSGKGWIAFAIVAVVVVVAAVFSLKFFTGEKESWQTIAQAGLCPNQWNNTYWGWQKIATLEPGTYRISAQGSYRQIFNDGKGISFEEISADGRFLRVGGVKYINTSFQNRLPLPNCPVGMVVISYDGRTVPPGVIALSERTEIWGSVNMPQDSNEFGTPAENFTGNTGSIEIRIERLR